MVTKLGPLRKVKLLNNKGDTLVVRSPQKAGVGGFNSLPGHHISKNLAESRLALPVRYFPARFGSVPGCDDGEGLKLELPVAQSASVCDVAQALPLRQPCDPR